MKTLADLNVAAHHQFFFKTRSGEYGEGDLFLGLKVPTVRKLAAKYTPFYHETNINELLCNPYHEVRLLGLLILINKFQKASTPQKTVWYNLYLEHLPFVNNWDLVDVSAPKVLGAFTFPDSGALWSLAKSGHLWSERAAVVAQLYYIRRGDYETALQLCEFFLGHRHSLMHKACGWILREVGKKDLSLLYTFLDKFSADMPRTMLRYSLERVPPEKKQHYMAQKNLQL